LSTSKTQSAYQDLFKVGNKFLLNASSTFLLIKMIEDPLEVWNFTKKLCNRQKSSWLRSVKSLKFFTKKVLMDRNWDGWRFAKYLKVY
jgi:hypothetical protein